MKKNLVVAFLVSICGFQAADEAALKKYHFSEPHMGTTVSITLYAKDEATANKAAQAAFARVAELDGIMSDYKPASELMQLCKKAGGPPVPVSKDLFTVLEYAQEVSQKSDGALDVTVGPVVRLWRKARRTRELPSAEALAKARALVGYEKMKLDPKKRTVQLTLMGMLLDLGAIAKGFTADCILAVLRQFGITRAMAVLGGDIAVGEAPPRAKGWKIGIALLKNPLAKPAHYVLLTNKGVSTAGDVEQYVEIGGKRYSHIVDPKTGLGLVGRMSVTVIAKNGLTADALDTTACVLGPERGLKLIEDTPGAAGFLVFGDRTLTTRNFAEFEAPAEKQ
jgi:thiamine biosynthesis lipoprotein